MQLPQPEQPAACLAVRMPGGDDGEHGDHSARGAQGGADGPHTRQQSVRRQALAHQRVRLRTIGKKSGKKAPADTLPCKQRVLTWKAHHCMRQQQRQGGRAWGWEGGEAGVPPSTGGWRGTPARRRRCRRPGTAPGRAPGRWTTRSSTAPPCLPAWRAPICKPGSEDSRLNKVYTLFSPALYVNGRLINYRYHHRFSCYKVLI